MIIHRCDKCKKEFEDRDKGVRFLKLFSDVWDNPLKGELFADVCLECLDKIRLFILGE